MKNQSYEAFVWELRPAVRIELEPFRNGYRVVDGVEELASAPSSKSVAWRNAYEKLTGAEKNSLPSVATRRRATCE